jgi:Ankyrin repeat
MSLSSCFVAAMTMAVSLVPGHVFAQACEQLAEAVRRNSAIPGSLARELQQKPDVNCRLESGETPLLLAARAGDTAGVEDLLAHGADPNVGRNAREPASVFRRVAVNVETPLILAAARGNEAMVRTLLNAGARASLTWTGEGTSPSQLALERRHRETFRILKAAEEAEYGPGAGSYVEEDIALRRILYLARNPRDVSAKSAPDRALLLRIARDAYGMDRNWTRAFRPRDQSFSWAVTYLARTLEWALHTGDNRLLRMIAEDLATKRRDCDASSEGRFGTIKISVRTLANASERQGLQVRYLERIFYDLLEKRPELQKQWREFAAVSAIRDEPLIAGDYILIAWDGGKPVSEPKPISVGRDRPTQFDIVVR